MSARAQHPSGPTPPKLIGNRWRVEGVLGRGGMGMVLQCTSRGSDKPVAIKLLTSDHPSAAARFRREAQLLVAANHPNIVRGLHADLEGPSPFIVMELAPGLPLSQVLRSEGGLRPFLALHYIEQLTQAMAYLHARGVSHRDLKPSNLIVDGDQLKLVDFGIAKPDGRTAITTGDSVVGTVAYAPPEWMWPSRVDPERWDVYSVGVLLYEALTAHRAYRMNPDLPPLVAAMNVMRRKQRDAHLVLDPGYPSALARIVAWSTSNDVTQRPSAAEMLPVLSEMRRLRSIRDHPARICRPARPPAVPTWVRDDEDAPSLAPATRPSARAAPQLPGPPIGIPLALVAMVALVFAYAGWLSWLVP